MLETVREKREWTQVKFGDVVRKVANRVEPEESELERYVAGEHMETDDLRVRRWGTIGADYLGPAFHMRFKPGQVLYGSRRTYLRKVSVPHFEGVTANTTFVLEPKDPNVLQSELLPFIMQTPSFHAHSIGQSKGSVNPYINFSDIAWYEFRLPPQKEQRRIAEVFRALLEEREALRQLRIRLKSVAEAYLEARQRMFDDALSSVGDLLSEPPRNGISPSASSEDSGLWTVSISSVRDGIFEPEGNRRTADVDRERASPFFVQRGDVFVVRGNGNRSLCGKAGIAEDSYEDLFYPDLLIRLRFDPSTILPEFAVAQWNLPSVHRRLSARAKSSNGIWKVNGNDIRRHRLVVPPRRTQEIILAEVREIEHALRHVRGREDDSAQLYRLFLELIDPQS